MNGKRLPKSKSGRLLVAVRDNLVSEANRLIRPDKKPLIEKLNKRIRGRLHREDLKNVKQGMLTDSRSVIEYRDKGIVIRASFTGSIADAKANLIQQRRRESIKEELPVFLWGHQTKGNELLIHGMWTTMEVTLPGVAIKGKIVK